jgi:hypothetical protein
MGLRARLFVWRAVRRAKAQPSPTGRGRRGYALNEPSKHDHFKWPGGYVFVDGGREYRPAVDES